MCLAKESSPSPQKEVSPPRSPWMKLLNRQSLKPRLSRKVTSSAKVNLNKCWSKLGELISNSAPLTDLPSYETAHTDKPVLIPFSKYLYPVDPVKSPTEEEDNMENQNILNLSRFQLIEDQEINENMANEVKEICFAANNNCRYCQLC